MKIGILDNFAKFTGKHLYRSLHLLNKVADWKPAILSKKRLRYRCFPINFVKFLRTPFLQNTSGWPLLVFRNFTNQIIPNNSTCSFCTYVAFPGPLVHSCSKIELLGKILRKYTWQCSFYVNTVSSNLTLPVLIPDKSHKGLYKTFWGTTKKCEIKNLS